MTQYDAIAAAYARVKDNDFVDKYAVYSSFYAAVGKVRDQSVLDLACGEGRVSREMAQSGASQVLGIDRSRKMLKIGRERSAPASIIEYRYGRVGQLDDIGQFGTVTAAWLLHYSRSREELFAMCADIGRCLKTGGRFIALNPNPRSPLRSCTKYGFTVSPARPGPLRDGSRLTVNIFGNGSKAAFNTYHYEWGTYERAMRAARLTLKCVTIKPSAEGYRLKGVRWWKEFLDEPSGVIFVGHKE